MFFKNKINKLIDVKKIEEEHSGREPLELENDDFKAMIIAAFIVFSPVVLGLSVIVLLLYFFFAG